MADNMLVTPAIDLNQLPGDFNRDQHSNAADIPAMMAALTDLNSYQSANVLTDAQMLAIGDIDHDSRVSNADLQGFLVYLQSGGGALTAVPEPQSVILMATAAAILVGVQLGSHFAFRRLAPARNVSQGFS